MVLAQLGVQRFTHAVQALELEAAVAARLLQERRHRQCVVGSELREQAAPQSQQFLRAAYVVQIGHRFAGEHRIVVEAALLRALDLGVPIGALDQTDHHPAIERAGEFVDVIDHGFGAFLVGLNCETETVPAVERAIACGSCDHVH